MKAHFGHLLSVVCLAVATLFITGCGPSEQEKEQARQQAMMEGLDAASRLLFSGQIDAALVQLERLDQNYPNEPDVLEALAFAYAKKPDHALAGFYFDTVVQLDPSRTELALYAARSHTETGDSASAALAYETYLKDSPDDAGAWLAYARALVDSNKRKPALDAYMEATRRSGANPGALDSSKIGMLYVKLGNRAQARRWAQAALSMAAEENSKQQALLTLLELDLSEQKWSDAEKRIAELDKVDAEALDNSPLASARPELKQWRANQQAAAKALADARLAENRKRFADAQARQTTQRTPDAASPDEAPATTETEEATETTAVDETTEVTEPTEAAESTITVDRTVETTSLTDSLAAPDGGQKLPPAPQATPEDPQVAIPPAQLAVETSAESASEPELATPATSSFAVQGSTAYDAGDFAGAARLYQSALAENPDATDVYYELSRAYYNLGRWQQAELYAAEARRRDPQNLRYAVNYLRAVQKTQSRERLMAELIRAKQRFPNSPDVTLALARGYERIYNNRRNAVFLYEDFLKLAPGHPQADEARQRLNELQ